MVSIWQTEHALSPYSKLTKSYHYNGTLAVYGVTRLYHYNDTLAVWCD